MFIPTWILILIVVAWILRENPINVLVGIGIATAAFFMKIFPTIRCLPQFACISISSAWASTEVFNTVRLAISNRRENFVITNQSIFVNTLTVRRYSLSSTF